MLVLVIITTYSVLYLFSLENMYKELSSDVENFAIPSHGCLTGWAEQGLSVIGLLP